MPAGAVLEKSSGRVDEQGLLFEYTIKLVLLAGFLELVLYRLISRLGMHLSKVAQKHESVRLTFKALSSIGFTLLNVVAIFVFLALVVLVANKMNLKGLTGLNRLSLPCVSLLLVLTVAFLIVPPAMLGSIIYNVVAFLALTILFIEYWIAHPSQSQRAFGLSYYLGVSGWLYYQTFSTGYGLLGVPVPPPYVHEINRAGEALMVLASILAVWAYGPVSLKTRNKRQRRRAWWFWSISGFVFGALLFLDYFLSLYDPKLAETIRKAGEGVSWIFQMGMGYTFYLPFAFYVAGLLGWAYTVIKLVTMGRLAGYGLGIMFMAGYALQLSHLTLMVILGMMLLNLDLRRVVAVSEDRSSEKPIVSPPGSLVSEHT